MIRFVAAVLLLAAAAAPAQEPDVWGEHALGDDEAAIAGRATMPFTQEQIEQLGLLLRQVRAATARGGGAVPEALHRRIRFQPGHVLDIPPVALARGYTTAISFTDVTGEPWPIEEVLVDEAFLPARAGERPDGARHLLYLAPVRANAHGNAIVKLKDLTEPVVLALGDGAGSADFRVDIRIARAGPLADPEALVSLPPFQAGDDDLLHLLAGLPPADATRLAVAGGDGAHRAWAQGVDILLVTSATLLSPGPWAAERSASGQWAYRLPATPFALVSAGGRETRIDFRAEPTAANLEEILR